jgi:hypothetical protein
MAYNPQLVTPPITTLKIKGLSTNTNQYGSSPEGALAIAQNIAISKADIAESRRGFTYSFSLPLSTDRADKLLQFQGKLIAHYGSSLGYCDGSAFHPYTGSYSHPDPILAKINSAEANQNLYFTTSTGTKKLDAVTNQPMQAGVDPGLDLKAVASANVSGWMPANSQVAYRVVFALSDANSNLVLGSPSQRALVSNVSGSVAQDTSIQITLPATITTNHIFQLYRSNLSTLPATPDDNGQLVASRNPTSAEVAAKSLTVVDQTPDSLKGAFGYYVDSQQGILQSNDLPPFAGDIATYRDCLFFGNIKTKNSLILNIVSVGGANGIQLGDVITIAGTAYTAATTENVSTLSFALVTTGSVSQNINDTALSLIRVVNQNATNTAVYARYLSGTSSLPGQIQFFERVLGGTAFTITASAHGSAYSPALPTSGSIVIATNSKALNGLMYSKQGIPEAVPALNILYVGSASKKILRIIALRDSLCVLKEDGYYRVSGTSPANFTVDLIDSSAILVAPESAQTLNNTIMALCQQGVMKITDTDASIVSESIEDQIKPLCSGTILPSTSANAFAITYETDRKYILWVPQTSSDTSGALAFVYDIYTKTWVTWTRQQQHGIVLKSEQKIYLANVGTSQLSAERKDFAYTDFADESTAANIISFSGTTVFLDSVLNVAPGDMVYQSASVSSVILSVNTSTSSVVVTDTLTWTVGACTLYKAISCLIEWLPFDAANPGELKHFREASLIFKENTFQNGRIGFYSELAGAVQSIPFSGASLYGWGRSPWGSTPWGGASRPANFRTYITPDQQRCDFLSVQFGVTCVWGRFQLQGLSLILNNVSERVSR